MPYKLTKQEKEFIRRQYRENVRILNRLLPNGMKIREDLKALNKRLNDPKEQRFYKKSLEINNREDLKTGASSRLLMEHEQLRDKSKPHPLERLMHTELATDISESANKYNEAKIKNYYAHPEAETQRKFQKLLNMDFSTLAKVSRSNDLDNLLLDYYEKNSDLVDDAFSFIHSVDKFDKDDLTPEMQTYLKSVGRNYEQVLLAVNSKVSRVRENYYFSFPELNQAQIDYLEKNPNFGDYPELQREYGKYSTGKEYYTKLYAQFKNFFEACDDLNINTSEPGVLSKVVVEQEENGQFISLPDYFNNAYQGNGLPQMKVLNEQEAAGVKKLFKKDYTKEKGFLDLSLPAEFQKPWAEQARDDFMFNYALDRNLSLGEVDNKGLGELASEIKGGIKETLFRTTSREYKAFIKAMKDFENPGKVNEYRNGSNVITKANNYLVHRGITTMEQAEALPEPQRSRCILCLTTMNTFQKFAPSNVQKLVPGTNQVYQTEAKKNDWPPAIEDASLVEDNVIDNNIIPEKQKEVVKENNIIEEEEINTNEIKNN